MIAIIANCPGLHPPSPGKDEKLAYCRVRVDSWEKVTQEGKAFLVVDS
jgi:hypothetical protein